MSILRYFITFNYFNLVLINLKFLQMKKLDLHQMENLEGGVSQRNCGILGLTIVASAMFGGWVVTIGAVAAAATADCF
jgi:hypothetical protein